MDKGLFNRMYEFLKKKNDWVREYDLKDMALKTGYAEDEINDALERLRNTVDVGHKNFMYKWYEVSEEQKLKMQKNVDWFNNI